MILTTEIPENNSTYLVYFFYNFSGDILYIGKTTNLKARMRQHLSPELVNLEPWKSTIDRNNILTFKCENACDLDLYETYFINKYKPIYNKDKVFNASPSFELPYLEPVVHKFKLEKIKGISFKELLKEYCQLIDIDENPERQRQLISLYPELKEYVDILGTSRIRSLCFCKKNLELEIYKTSEEIKNIVGINAKNELELNKFYSFYDLKIYLNKIYQNLNLNHKAKAIDIEDYFITRPSSKRVNGKKVKGLVLLKYK